MHHINPASFGTFEGFSRTVPQRISMWLIMYNVNRTSTRHLKLLHQPGDGARGSMDLLPLSHGVANR